MIKKVLGLYIIWIILINLFAIYSLNRLNLLPDNSFVWFNPKEFYPDRSISFIDLHSHWDSVWYLRIASNGYHYDPSKMSDIAFFPLYPILIWTLSLIPFITPALAGWIISMVSLGIGFVYLYKLVKEFYPQIDPLYVISLVLIFPTAFFLNSIYTESLFLSLSIISFYYLFKKQFIYSALFISLASLSRVNGVFLLLPFAFEYYRTFGIKGLIRPQIFSFLIATLGIFLYMGYLYWRFNEPLAFMKTQVHWGRNFLQLNVEHFTHITPASYANFGTDLLLLAFGILGGILLIKYLRASFGVYCLATILIAISGGTLMSVNRYGAILFPILIMVAQVKNPLFRFGWQLTSILLLAIYTTLFINNYWAG